MMVVIEPSIEMSQRDIVCTARAPADSAAHITQLPLLLREKHKAQLEEGDSSSGDHLCSLMKIRAVNSLATTVAQPTILISVARIPVIVLATHSITLTRAHIL
jgi:hypothetical protein